jgi:hypothetical protein
MTTPLASKDSDEQRDKNKDEPDIEQLNVVPHKQTVQIPCGGPDRT